MRLPKKVLIAGKWWKVLTDKTMVGGHFNGNKYEIKIGTKNPKDVLETFLHEVVEATLMERHCRFFLYEVEGNEQFQFIFNHEQFIHVMRDLSTSLQDLIGGSK